MSFVPAHILSAEDAAARDGFAGRVAETGVAYVVEGRDGIAQISSVRHLGTRVELLWSDRAEAARWATSLAVEPQIHAVALADLLATHLTGLDAAGSYAGPDWSDLPAEPEVTGLDLIRVLRRACVAEFARSAHTTRQVWLLRQGEQFATIPATGSAPLTIPVFASADQAADLARTIPGATPYRQPLAEFIGKTLMTCIAKRQRLAPAYMPGPGVLELAPWDMKALLNGTQPPMRVA